MPVNKYVLYCITEQQFVTVWSEKTPISCPNNNNHEISLDSIGITETMNNQTVYIAGKDNGQTNGFYILQGKNTNINTDSIVYDDTIFKVPSCIFGLMFTSTLDQKGDKFDVIVNPDTTIGMITQVVNTGDKNIHVSQTVIEYLKPGMFATLSDDTNKNDLGMILNVNTETSTITTDLATTNSFEINSLINMNLYVVKDYPLEDPWKHEIGYGAFGGKFVPANTIFRLIYHNNNGVAKTFSYSYEITY